MGASSSSASGNPESMALGRLEKTSKEDLNAIAPINESGIDDGLLGPEVQPHDKPELPEGPRPPSGSGPGSRRPPPSAFPRPRPNDNPRWVPDVDINGGHGTYTTKKNIAQGMMDLALLTANASQLRYVLRSNATDAYHVASVVLISLSIALQIIVGVALIFIGRYDYKNQERRHRAQTANNLMVALVFFITVINVFIAVFGVDDDHSVLLLKLKESEKLAQNCKPVIFP